MRDYSQFNFINVDDLTLIDAVVPNVWFIETIQGAQALSSSLGVADNLFGIHTASLLGASIFDFTVYGDMSNLDNTTSKFS